jgi:hypothetical protein
VIVRFVDIDVICDHHCLSFLFLSFLTAIVCHAIHRRYPTADHAPIALHSSPRDQLAEISSVRTQYKTKTYDVGNLGPSLGQTQQCGGVKPVNGDPTNPPLLITGSPTFKYGVEVDNICWKTFSNICSRLQHHCLRFSNICSLLLHQTPTFSNI